MLASAQWHFVFASSVLGAPSVPHEAHRAKVRCGGAKTGGGAGKDKVTGIGGGVVPATSRVSCGDASVARSDLVDAFLKREDTQDVELGPSHGLAAALKDGEGLG